MAKERMKPLPKALLFLLMIGAIIFGLKAMVQNGIIARPSMMKSLIPLKSDEINAVVLDNPGNIKPVDLGNNKPVPACVDGNISNCIQGAIHEVAIWAWSANGGLITATGGAKYTSDKDSKIQGLQTSVGSLMAKYNVNLRLTRQDDTGQMKVDLVDTATRLQSDPNAPGVKFITNMGDGAGQFLADVKKVCPKCELEVVGVLGYSRGEDGLWGPPMAKNNCEALRGGIALGVVRDGDWNIAQKKLSQCNIPNNPDETMYDPQGFNWINAPDYLKAVEMLLGSGTCLPVGFPVKGGGVLKQQKCAEYVVTWTPGDVNIATKKGGLVPIMTTRQSIFQMPCALIGIKQWDSLHREDVKNILKASFEAADQMRTNPVALQRFGELSAKLYAEQSAAYWIKYYHGVTEPDLTGNPVALGGSAVSNLADNLQAFGLSGGPNLFAATYNTFGKIVVQQYPKMYPDFPPIEKVLNTSFVLEIKASNTLPIDNGEKVLTTESTAPMKAVEGKKDYAIQFASGKSDILPVSFSVLNQVADDIMITKYVAALHGFTDNAKWQGMTAEQSEDKNLQLSGSRATAVETYLRKHGVRNIIRVYPHGQENPVADNDSESGRATNRRVQVVLGVIE